LLTTSGQIGPVRIRLKSIRHGEGCHCAIAGVDDRMLLECSDVCSGWLFYGHRITSQVYNNVAYFEFHCQLFPVGLRF